MMGKCMFRKVESMKWVSSACLGKLRVRSEYPLLNLLSELRLGILNLRMEVRVERWKKGIIEGNLGYLKHIELFKATINAQMSDDVRRKLCSLCFITLSFATIFLLMVTIDSQVTWTPRPKQTTSCLLWRGLRHCLAWRCSSMALLITCASWAMGQLGRSYEAWLFATF